MGMRWFVVHTYSGYENKVKKSLEERVRQDNLQELFGEILIPTEQVVGMVKGEKRTTRRKIYPGYIYVQMGTVQAEGREIPSPTAWGLVKNTPKVTGFVGGRQPEDTRWITDDEVRRLTSQMTEGTAKAKPAVQFETGDHIRVTDGPLNGFNGTVEEVNADKGRLRVLVSIFGRATPYELDFMQVEKTQ
jgi:transcriptional antiterminator NusG